MPRRRKDNDLASVLRELRLTWPTIVAIVEAFDINLLDLLLSAAPRFKLTIPRYLPKSDPYEVLGVERNAEFDKVKDVYRKLSKIYHPDMDTGNEEVFKRMNQAYKQIARERGLI